MLLGLKLGFYVRNGGLAEAVQKDGLGADFSAERLEVARMLLKAAEAAIRAGRIRADVDVETCVILQQAIAGAMLTGGTLAERRRRAGRLRAILVDGLAAR